MAGRSKVQGKPDPARSLTDVAQTKPDSLRWMLSTDYFDDTKTLAFAALKQAS